MSIGSAQWLLGGPIPAVAQSSRRVGSKVPPGLIAALKPVDGLGHGPLIEAERRGEGADGPGLRGAVQGRQEQPVDLRVPDRVGDLAGLLRDVAAPDRVPLRPDLLAFVVEPPPGGVDDDPEGDRVQPGGDAAVEAGGTRVHGDRVEAPFLARAGGPVGVQRGQDPAVVVPRAADEVVVRGVAPVPAQPGDVGLEAAAGGHHRPGADHAVGREQAGAPSPIMTRSSTVVP